MFVALGNQTFTIKGILQYDIDYYSYQISYHPDFFLDIESIEKIQFDYWKEYEDYLVSLENTESSDEYMQQYFDNVLESSSIWESSALVVQVNDEKNINQVMKDITRLDSLLHIVITDYGISLADTNLNANVIRTAFLYSSVIYGVLLFAMIIIMFYRKEKRKEIEDLLIINGFTQSELNSINMFERKIEIIVVTIISVMLSIVFFMSLNQLLYYEVQFTLGYVIFIFTAIILVILASEITTKNITKRRKEEKE